MQCLIHDRVPITDLMPLLKKKILSSAWMLMKTCLFASCGEKSGPSRAYKNIWQSASVACWWNFAYLNLLTSSFNKICLPVRLNKGRCQCHAVYICCTSPQLYSMISMHAFFWQTLKVTQHPQLETKDCKKLCSSSILYSRLNSLMPPTLWSCQLLVNLLFLKNKLLVNPRTRRPSHSLNSLKCTISFI